MIKQILIVIALIGISSNALAQKINEKELMGSWNMVIDIDAAMKDAKKDLNIFEKMNVDLIEKQELLYQNLKIDINSIQLNLIGII